MSDDLRDVVARCFRAGRVEAKLYPIGDGRWRAEFNLRVTGKDGDDAVRRLLDAITEAGR